MRSDVRIQDLLVIYLILLNILTMAIFGLDKWLAKRGMSRVPEKTLLGLVLAGGSLGGLVGMNLFHHKTRVAKFRWGIPAIMGMEMLLGYYFW